jgi:hypothetical protein
MSEDSIVLEWLPKVHIFLLLRNRIVALSHNVYQHRCKLGVLEKQIRLCLHQGLVHARTREHGRIVRNAETL